MIERVEKLSDILTPEPGQIVYVESEEKVYRFDPVEGWQVAKMDSNISLSTYDINKMVVGSLPSLSDELIADKKKDLKDFITKTKNKYYMLLNNELKYYTLLHLDKNKGQENVEDIIIECLTNMGEIKMIDPVQSEPEDNINAMELWITAKDETSYVFYLFGYDEGVIICK